MADREPCACEWLPPQGKGTAAFAVLSELPSEPAEGPLLDRQPTDKIWLYLRDALLCISVICNVAVGITVPNVTFLLLLLSKCDPEPTFKLQWLRNTDTTLF